MSWLIFGLACFLIGAGALLACVLGLLWLAIAGALGVIR